MIFLRSYVANQNLKKSDSEDHPDSRRSQTSDSEGQDLDKLKDKRVEALKIKPELF
jgi:hypothetical protein